MTALDGLWHLLNLFAPALGVGVLTAGLAKLLWWSDLRGVSWWRLSGWGVACSSAASVAGLFWAGHDGKMMTYAAMVAACSFGLWWGGWRSGR